MTTVTPVNDATQEVLTQSEEILRRLNSMTGVSAEAEPDVLPAKEAPQQPDDLLDLLEKTRAAYLEKLAGITAEIKNAQIAKLEASLKS